MAKELNFIIKTLGEAKIKSPVNLSRISGDLVADFVRDDNYFLVEAYV